MVWFWLHLARTTQLRGFIEKIRHRNIFRVGVAYVVTGWLIVQVADVAVKGVGSNFFRGKAAVLAIGNRLSSPADSSSAPRHE
jgi:hypothetical protein